MLFNAALQRGDARLVSAFIRDGAPSAGATSRVERAAVPLRTVAARALVLLEEGGSAWLDRAACLGFFAGATSGYAWLLNALTSATGTPRPLDRFTALTLARTQLPNGRWRVGAPRLPIQESDIQTTAQVIRVLLTFAPAHPETASRVERARAWLLSSAPANAHDRAYRLLGLRWAGADRSDVKDAMKALVKEQDESGGWSPLPGLNPEAYATGLALVALREGAEMPPAHRAYQRGVGYLLRTQERATPTSRAALRTAFISSVRLPARRGRRWPSCMPPDQSHHRRMINVAENQRCRAGLHGRIDGRHNQLSPVDR